MINLFYLFQKKTIFSTKLLSVVQLFYRHCDLIRPSRTVSEAIYLGNLFNGEYQNIDYRLLIWEIQHSQPLIAWLSVLLTKTCILPYFIPRCVSGNKFCIFFIKNNSHWKCIKVWLAKGKRCTIAFLPLPTDLEYLQRNLHSLQATLGLEADLRRLRCESTFLI